MPHTYKVEPKRSESKIRGQNRLTDAGPERSDQKNGTHYSIRVVGIYSSAYCGVLAEIILA
jgi:hypothetical protein